MICLETNINILTFIIKKTTLFFTKIDNFANKITINVIETINLNKVSSFWKFIFVFGNLDMKTLKEWGIL